MTFKSAVRQTAEITTFEKGLRAIKGEHRLKFDCKPTCRWCGSVNLEDNLKYLYPSKPQWDYAIGIKINGSPEQSAFVEVHPADTANVTEILRKKEALDFWLSNKAPALRMMPCKGFFWLSTDGIHILKNSRQNRLLAQSGIIVKSKLFLG